MAQHRLAEENGSATKSRKEREGPQGSPPWLLRRDAVREISNPKPLTLIGKREMERPCPVGGVYRGSGDGGGARGAAVPSRRRGDVWGTYWAPPPFVFYFGSGPRRSSSPFRLAGSSGPARAAWRTGFQPSPAQPAITYARN